MTELCAQALSDSVRTLLPVATIADLRALDAPDETKFINVLGYHSAGDGGGGEFYWDAASTASDDGGTVIKPTAVSGAGRWLRIHDGTLYAKWFGAKGDGSTNDLAALQAFDAAVAAAHGVGIVTATNGGYAVNATWAISHNSSIVFEPDAFVLYTGSANEPAIDVAASGLAIYKSYVLAAVRSTQSTWANEGSVGIRMRYVTESDITILRAEKFAIGFQPFPTNGQGFAWNRVELGVILANKVQVDLRSGGGSGYINENNFWGGRLGTFSGTNANVARYGVRFSRESGGYAGHNNNRFWGTSFELSQTDAGAQEALPVLAEVGSNNFFFAVRSEDNHATYFARENNDCTGDNTYDLGYVSSAGTSIDWSISDRSSMVLTPNRRVYHRARTIWHSGHIPRKTVVYETGGTYSYNVAGMHVGSNAASFPLVMTASANPKTATYLELGNSRSIGVLLNTTQCKRFVIRRELKASQHGRLAFRCYDGHPAAGASIITGSAGQADNNVRGVGNSDPTYTADWGGSYAQGADGADDVGFMFGTSVKYVAVLAVSGTNNPHIASMEIAALDDLAAGVEPGHGRNETLNYLPEPPSQGTYDQGYQVWEETPAGSATPGWVCVTGGTPGTWKAMANLAA